MRDSAGNKIDNVNGLAFTFGGGLRFSKFILAGPRLEEFLENIRVKLDRDPAFDVSPTRKIDNNADNPMNTRRTRA